MQIKVNLSVFNNEISAVKLGSIFDKYGIGYHIRSIDHEIIEKNFDQLKKYEVIDTIHNINYLSIYEINAKHELKDANVYRFMYLFKAIERDFLFNQNFIAMPMEEVAYNTYLPSKFFAKPDSGFKLFSGQVFDKARWMEEVKYLKQTSRDRYLDDLVIISAPKEIKAEYRVIVHNRKPITASLYGYEIESKNWDKNSDALFSFVEKALLQPKSYLPERLVLDVAEIGSDIFKILEINCFSTSSFYDCDWDKIAQTFKKD